MQQIIKDITRLAHIQQASQRIATCTVGYTVAQFITDETLQDVVIRQLTIIGEALAHVSPATRQAYPHLDWRAATGLRNFVVHEYFRVDLPTVWTAATVDLPILAQELDAIRQNLQAQLSGAASV